MQTDLEQLRQIFLKMIKDGFDVKKPLKWSFYFVNSEKSQLEILFKELADHKYSIEKLDNSIGGKWILQVSKIDTLTFEKLHKRNIAFNELADYCDIELYDGWDVEKLPII